MLGLVISLLIIALVVIIKDILNYEQQPNTFLS